MVGPERKRVFIVLSLDRIVLLLQDRPAVFNHCNQTCSIGNNRLVKGSHDPLLPRPVVDVLQQFADEFPVVLTFVQ